MERIESFAGSCKERERETMRHEKTTRWPPDDDDGQEAKECVISAGTGRDGGP